MSSRVLFVDDDELILHTFRVSLRNKFDLTVALGPEAALESLEGSQFAVMVADMSMPVMDGLQLIARAKNIRPEMVCIILSGTVNLAETTGEADRRNVYCFLEKPCPRAKLIETINAAICLHEQASAQRTGGANPSERQPDSAAVLN